jgi:hypothetical protein
MPEDSLPTAHMQPTGRSFKVTRRHIEELLKFDAVTRYMAARSENLTAHIPDPVLRAVVFALYACSPP